MRYEFWIDRGGTFTDCLLLDRESGKLSSTKVLSADNSPLVGIRTLLELPPNSPIPPSHIKMGTTVATNALLERKGAKTGLLITRGFHDLLLIGDQTRPDLFDLHIERPRPLYEAVEEMSARLDRAGVALEIPSDEELQDIVEKFSKQGIESIALVTLHAYANPEFEQDLKRRVEKIHAEKKITCTVIASTDAACEQGLLARTSTTILDAYLTPLLQQYLGQIQNELPGSRLSLMQSSGGLIPPHLFRGPASLLSGPAGGIVAAERIAKRTQSRTLISFDMGGTSTDVTLIREIAERRYEKEIAGVALRAPMIDIHTVAAGGGSICQFNGYNLTVGPESVGAQPGPICYGLNKESEPQLALTDINLSLGRIAPDYFTFPLHADAALHALEVLAAKIAATTGKTTAPQALARAFAEVANANMCEAIRTVTVSRGIDTRDADLLVFGGAAGQHACALASALGISRIFVHCYSGILSAFGIGHADTLWTGEHDAGRFVLSEKSLENIEVLLLALESQGELKLRATDVRNHPAAPLSELKSTRQLALRYRGTESVLPIEWGNADKMRARFESEHLTRFGFLREQAEIEIVTARVALRIEEHLPHVTPPASSKNTAKKLLPAPIRTEKIWLERRVEQNTPVYELKSLKGCPPLNGPALLLDPTSTYLVDESFEASFDGEILTISRTNLEENSPQNYATNSPDLARISIMATRFASAAEQMGEALRKSASSTNIRDRLDFSCAIFDTKGRLIANAPHIPVHLGAMSESVSAVLDKFPRLTAGEAYVTNDPALGGSHLPDITVVSPVFDHSGKLVCITASRGHHADVGGISPGSMPAFSRSLEEEGVVFSAIKLVSGGIFQEANLRKVLGGGPQPARNPEENLADLRAQLAANQLGAKLMLQLLDETGVDDFSNAMRDVRELSSKWMRDAISSLPDGARTFQDSLDNGAEIVVTVTVQGTEIEIDFSGSAPEQDNNFNAPRAVTIACVMYVMRTLLNRPIPLNEGCLAPVRLIIPERSIINPSRGRPVAAGNVETSSRIVDVLLGALGLAAASQGTMNNLSFGNESFGYYETIAGGAGAGPTFPGASGVHTHMTNTRITDPEVLEDRFPVRLVEFSLRKESAGRGQQNGGEGLRRTLQALEPLRYSLLTNRRDRVPFGLAGGEPGAPGVNRVRGQKVPACIEGTLAAGDELQLETPGGGGYGAPTFTGSSPSVYSEN